MRKLITILVVILLMSILLVLTNPTKDHFLDWAMKEVEKNSGSEIGDFLGGLLGRPLLNVSTSRKDYLLFSVFTINKANDQGVFLGLLRYIFIEIK